MDEATTPAEYPKMLYKDGQPYGDDGRGVPHQHTRTVTTAEEEAEAREEGFDVAFQGEPHAPPADEAPQGEEGPPVDAPADDNATAEGADTVAG